MGEMCDFESEYYPRNWLGARQKKCRTKAVQVTLSLEMHAKLKQLGGVVALKRLIAEAPVKVEQGGDKP